MLMGFGFGTLPSTRTMPFSVAAPAAPVLGGGPAFTAEDVLMPMMTVREKIEISFLSFIDLYLTSISFFRSAGAELAQDLLSLIALGRQRHGMLQFRDNPAGNPP